MTSTALVEQALALPHADSSYVAERLISSLEDERPLSPDWRAEIERRVARRERGESRTYNREEVRRNVQALLA
jgi:hypothetical protein